MEEWELGLGWFVFVVVVFVSIWVAGKTYWFGFLVLQIIEIRIVFYLYIYFF